MACVNISGQLYQRDSLSFWNVTSATNELDEVNNSNEMFQLDSSLFGGGGFNSTGIPTTIGTFVGDTVKSSGGNEGVNSNGGLVCMFNPEQMLEPWEINKNLVMIISYSIIFVIGVIGNITAMLGMIGDRKSRNGTTLFLVSLSAADLLLLLVCAPLEALQYFVIQWDEVGTICKTAKYAEVLSAVASVLNLTAVSLERFIVIVFPIRSRSVCTMSNCRRAVLVVWIVSLILTAPVLFTKGTNPWTFSDGNSSITIFYCEDKGDGRIFAVYQAFILLLAPGLVMIICYTYVIRELWISTRNMRVLTNTSHNSHPPPSTNAADGRRWRVGSHLRMTMVQGSTRSTLNVPGNPIASSQSNILSTSGVRASATDELTSSAGQEQQQEECVLSPCPCGVLVQHPLQPQSSSLPDRNFALNNNSSGMTPPVMITTTSPTRRAEILLARIPTRESKVVRNLRSVLKKSTPAQTSNPRGHQARAEEARNARKQVIKMLILVIVLFLICWGSRLSMEISIKVGLDTFSPEMYVLRIVINLLPYVHSCLNPFIYSLMSKNFRRSMFRRLQACCCCFRRCSQYAERRRSSNINGDFSPNLPTSTHTPSLAHFNLNNQDVSSAAQGMRSMATRLAGTDTRHRSYQRNNARSSNTPLLMRRNRNDSKRPSLYATTMSTMSTTVVVSAEPSRNNLEIDTTLL